MKKLSIFENFWIILLWYQLKASFLWSGQSLESLLLCHDLVDGWEWNTNSTSPISRSRDHFGVVIWRQRGNLFSRIPTSYKPVKSRLCQTNFARIKIASYPCKHCAEASLRKSGKTLRKGRKSRKVRFIAACESPLRRESRPHRRSPGHRMSVDVGANKGTLVSGH